MYMVELDSQLRDRVREIHAELDVIGGIPKSSSSSADLEKIEAELVTISSQAEGAKSELTGITKQIKEIRKDRNVKFLNCFKFTSSKVDELYKALTSYSDPNTSLGNDAIVPLDVASTAAASLDLETPPVGSDLTACEVFNSGVIFSLMPPYKRYTNIELLSGGEKTVAAVALLFALLAYAGPPFSMVDEIDAALDADNVAVLSRFMKRAVDHQLIVISLKEKMFAKADCLIGVYKNTSTQGSGIVTLDLRQYPETTEGDQEETVVYEKRTSDTTPTAPVTEKRQGRVLAGGA
jgi:structural maintenance of chromosome 1